MLLLFASIPSFSQGLRPLASLDTLFSLVESPQIYWIRITRQVPGIWVFMKLARRFLFLFVCFCFLFFSLSLFFFFFLDCIYSFERGREREREHDGATGRGTEGKGETNTPLSREPNAGFHSRTLGSWSKPKAGTWLSHPGALCQQILMDTLAKES